MNLKPLPKLELLQALRALAALAVVFFHTGYAPGYGASGVSVFFALSGVIMAMLMDAGESSLQFMQRRLIRIVPLYWAATTVAALVTWFMPATRTSGNVGGAYEYLLSLFFIPFRAQDGNIVPMLGPGWTINYEIAFYLTCAVGIFLSRRRPVLATAVLVFGWWYLARLSLTSAGEFYQRPIALLFVAGMGLWRLSKLIEFRLTSLYALTSILAVCYYLARLEYLGNHQQGPAFVGYTKMFLALLIVGIGLFAEPAFQKLNQSVRWMLVKIGDASYAIYLTHIFIIHLLLAIAPKFGLSRDGLILAAISVVAAALVGDWVHRFLDAPVQKKIKNYFKTSL